MRPVAALVLLGLLSGCTAHRPPRMVSASWQTVQGIASGTELAVYLGEQDARYGVLEVVTSGSLTLRGRQGLESLVRAKIERVAVRTATGASRKAPIVQTALAGSAITGALAVLAEMMEENPRPDGRKWAFFIGGTAAAAGLGAMRAPRATYSERLIYIRP